MTRGYEQWGEETTNEKNEQEKNMIVIHPCDISTPTTSQKKQPKMNNISLQKANNENYRTGDSTRKKSFHYIVVHLSSSDILHKKRHSKSIMT